VKLTVLLGLGLLVLGSGCQNGIRDPITRVASVNIVEQSSEATRVEVTVELANPNRDPLPLTESAYTVRVGNARAFSSTEQLHRTIPSRGRQIVVLPAVFRGSAAAGGDYQVNGSVTYNPPGEIRRGMTEMGIPLPSTGFRDSGKLGEGLSTYNPREAEKVPATQPATQPGEEF
jgi:hypothetical protein